MIAKKSMVYQKRSFPERTCVSCKETSPKRELIRVVKMTDGQVKIDQTGKISGRGAYICLKDTCWKSKSLKKDLSRALKADLTSNVFENLVRYAETVLFQQRLKD